jgi:hypothetical protein
MYLTSANWKVVSSEGVDADRAVAEATLLEAAEAAVEFEVRVRNPG